MSPHVTGHIHQYYTVQKKATIHQVTTMLATGAWAINKLSGQYWWLGGGYDLKTGHF